MHRIVKSHLDSFIKEHGFLSDDEATQFEKFCNYCFLHQRISSKLDLDDITTLTDDDGMDGVALVVNEDLVQSKEDADVIFGKDRRNNDVDICFVQAKRSDSFDLGDFLKFKDSILRFLSQAPYLAISSLQKDVRAAFDVAIDNAPKIRGGKPSLFAHFVTTGVYTSQSAFEVAKREMLSQIESMGLFSKIDIKIFGRDELVKSWVDSYSGVEATLLMHSHAGLPQLSGIAESYLAVVKAKDFIQQILSGPDGTIRGQIFEDNVRHYLGSENPVNRSIGDTLEQAETSSRFPVLNNGVTLVSPDIVVQTNRLFIKNFQIVNGCQTSHVLFDNKDKIGDDVMVTLKVVETDDEDIFGELVRATNSQSAIPESQFLSLSPIARKVEAYFNTFEGQEGRLYFERRDRQYVGKGVPTLRIVDLDAAARAVCAMYLQRPDLAFKYPKQMYEVLGQQIFDEQNREIIYYSSALVLYRIHLLSSNGGIAGAVRKYKWHILALVGAMISGKSVPQLNSKKIDTFAQKIIKVFQVQNDKINDTLTRAEALIAELGEISNDRMRRQGTLDELFDRI
ncbi:MULTISPECIES: AIPR family protein [unclassified Janthinobacterium]|uniref:AIPR family protein n=1 Tax=unclassified Janthinobacterium TaxID=2610881 RepID=UPI001E55327A|nr:MULTISPECIES: AIPR family protein [unclassified Janthinobacterium]MCC7646538.1 AIPR family protein [Janthinobacterium sp. EB271-G4-3-1]MCC7693373.1 AIPR family protein [Janthinobacterium sp. EB271-G4-3-2]